MRAILHDIRSAHNVGSMFRTADAAGIERLYLTGYTPGPYNPRGKLRTPFAKVALGAERTVSWEHHDDPVALIRELREHGWTVYAIEQDARSVPYDTVHPTRTTRRHTAIIVGNEVEGLPRSVLRAVTAVLEIPMSGAKESLNVSVSFGIATFALRDGHQRAHH